MRVETSKEEEGLLRKRSSARALSPSFRTSLSSSLCSIVDESVGLGVQSTPRILLFYLKWHIVRVARRQCVWTALGQDASETHLRFLKDTKGKVLALRRT